MDPIIDNRPALLALRAFGLGRGVFFCGDKIVRPAVARNGARLGVLMGCLGGFEVLGLVGPVISPVVLTLLRELGQQNVRDLARENVADPASTGKQKA